MNYFSDTKEIKEINEISKPHQTIIQLVYAKFINII